MSAKPYYSFTFVNRQTLIILLLFPPLSISLSLYLSISLYLYLSAFFSFFDF